MYQKYYNRTWVKRTLDKCVILNLFQDPLMSMSGYIYILTNKHNTVFYIGVTSNLIKREWQHEHKITHSFTSKYNVDKLFYFEVFENITQAIAREKQLKKWHRQWKINLIKSVNPNFNNLMNLYGDAETSSA